MELTRVKKYSPQNRFAYEANYFYDYFRQIPFIKLKKLLDKSGLTINKETVLIASCGCGIDAHYLSKFYSLDKIFFSDINVVSFEKTRSNYQISPCIFADNYILPFKDASFDYVFIAASLHHLKEPIKGLYELLRVSRRGLIVIEPNDSWLTRLFEKLGLAHEYEVENGNYVYRFNKRDVAKLSKALFMQYKVSRFFAIHRTAKTGAEFLLLKIMNGLANVLCPYLGNYIVFVICKDAPLLLKK